MALRTESLESELIAAVCERIRDRGSSEATSACEEFARQYYHWVPPEDLADRTADDLYAAALAHWQLALEREPGEVKVRVYNPDADRDGWTSGHTVVDIVSDDMPFLVDSLTMALSRDGSGIKLVIHPVMRVRRDDEGRVTDVLERGDEADGVIAESILHAEVIREPDEDARERLRESMERVLDEVGRVVADWGAMRSEAEQIAEELSSDPPPIDHDEVEESEALVRWLVNDHFTFLGYREYRLTERDGDAGLEAIADSGLGILRGTPRREFTPLEGHALELARDPYLCVLTKANSRSTVHRPAYLDYVGVKKLSSEGNVIGERRFLGLYTHHAYRASALEIPILRGKVNAVLERAGFPPDSHDAKALTEILENYPRDSLFQIDTEDLFRISMGILGVGERPLLRLFLRRDVFGRFVACTVVIPRDRFNTQNRELMGEILADELDGDQVDWDLQRSESLLVRIEYTVRCHGGISADYDVKRIEERLIEATRAWSDDLRAALAKDLGEDRSASLAKRYVGAFSAAYRGDWRAESAVEDVHQLEHLLEEGGPIIRLYRPSEPESGVLRCKLFSCGDVALSDVLPTFEHMGARVVDERPYEVTPADHEPVWIYDFGLRAEAEDLERASELFEDVFLGVWRGELEDDGLNGLVLEAGLRGREITIVRAVAKYLRQAGIAFSDAYMERTLIGHPDIARLLVKLFVSRFDPEDRDQEEAERIGKEIEESVDAIPSLDEDRILRSFLAVIRAILRTNFFRSDEPGPAEGVTTAGGRRPFLSFKLDPEQIPMLPLPRPRYEIFVYSPRVEGVHLRGGRVARGGLRWSDRPEDFRTEVLGLMKAQMVKNALIVPVGSKGGFVVKRPPSGDDREAVQEEGIACYKTFLSGLLDLTDNIVGGDVQPPPQVVRYDDDDPYLVVAADKGTASFSDIANEVSADYGFWLGDAFASGGSKGYDHKAVGITARGAWESVKRHFRELGTDIQSTDFTAVGIGDMSGDVFGNGMLLSPHTRLIAAFNHAHVFLDPDPDPEESYEERKRLFEQPQSAWSDYNDELISAGGGVHERTAKSIKISKQVGEALSIDADELSPTELISAILKAPVDLLWNGGIGTYVKASSENNAEVGDKTNDGLRVDGSDLRCAVVGEGGNLGFTQRGRIEYALSGGPEGEGGRINTDAIDNVAGVNCSDHEVNIKILLDGLVANEEMTEDQRNGLLVEMTDAVAERVLYASYTQTQAMSLAMAQAAPMVDVHARLIRALEQTASLNREIEFLPSDDAIGERKVEHKGLVAPELAVVMAYCKIHLYADLLESDLPEDPYLAHDLERYFPAPLPDRYAEQMREHRLRREIIATVVANQLVDRAGTTFSFRLGEETGAPPSILARGYAVAREVFGMRSFWDEVESLDNQVAAQEQLRMLIEGRRLVERATRWLVRTYPRKIDIEETTRRYEPGVELLTEALPDVLDKVDCESFEGHASELSEAGVPAELARRVATMPRMLAVFDIVEIARAIDRDPELVMSAYFALGGVMVLTWLRDRIIELPRANRWQALSRAALRDDLWSLHRELTQQVLETGGRDWDAETAIAEWRKRNEVTLERTVGILDDIRASRTYDMTTLPVALREIRNLIAEARPDEETGKDDETNGAGA